MSRFILMITVAILCSASYANNIGSVTETEIKHLFAFIKASPCKFNRNGTWYSAAEAADHIDKKYQYVLKRGLIDSASDFIKYAATKSSISGKKYLVQCPNSEVIESADWLTSELSRYREGRKIEILVRKDYQAKKPLRAFWLDGL